ncbi:HAMP domain protein, partial [Vibrio cholerae HC-62B1]
GEFN